MKYFILMLTWIVICISLLVIYGWFADIDILKRIVPGFVTMKFTTALSFLLSGVILLVTVEREYTNTEWSSVILPPVTLVLLILIGTVVLSVLFGFKSGVENLFVKETVDAIFTSIPGRPSLGTLLAFSIIAVLGLITMSDWVKRMQAYTIFGYLLSSIGGVALVGYMLNTPLLFYTYTDISSAMAMHTAVLFVCVGVGYIVLARDRQRIEQATTQPVPTPTLSTHTDL